MNSDAAKSSPSNASVHTNQEQLATLMAAHYSGTRASVDDWLRRRDQYLMLYITGSGATLGVFLSSPQSALILFLIPALTVVILCAYLSADLHVAYLCRWLKIEYTALLDRFVAAHGVVSLTPWHWDNSRSLDEFYASGVGRMRYLFLTMTFVLANASAPTLAFAKSGALSLQLSLTCAATILIVFYALVAIYNKRKSMA